MDKLSFYVNKKIVYVDVIKTKNKNMYLKVRNNKIVVLVPPFRTEKYVRDFVSQHIVKYVAYIENVKANQLFSVEKKFFYLFGKKYLFEVLTGSKKNIIKKIGDKYYAETKTGDDAEVEVAIKELLKSTMLEYTEKVHRHFEKLMAVPEHKVIVRFKTSTWGSNMIGRQKISYSTRLVHYDHKVIDYVIVHELAHYIQPNHSSAFWAIVELYIPDYKNVQKTLKADTSNKEDA